jgi:hypothetical protein
MADRGLKAVEGWTVSNCPSDRELNRVALYQRETERRHDGEAAEQANKRARGIGQG